MSLEFGLISKWLVHRFDKMKRFVENGRREQVGIHARALRFRGIPVACVAHCSVNETQSIYSSSQRYDIREFFILETFIKRLPITSNLPIPDTHYRPIDGLLTHRLFILKSRFLVATIPSSRPTLNFFLPNLLPLVGTFIH